MNLIIMKIELEYKKIKPEDITVHNWQYLKYIVDDLALPFYLAAFGNSTTTW